METKHKDEVIVVESDGDLVKTSIGKDGLSWLISDRPNIYKTFIDRIFSDFPLKMLEKLKPYISLDPIIIKDGNPSHQLCLDSISVCKRANNYKVVTVSFHISSVHGYYDITLSRFVREKLFQRVNVDKVVAELDRFGNYKNYLIEKTARKLDMYNKTLFNQLMDQLLGCSEINPDDVIYTNDDSNNLFVCEGAFEVVTKITNMLSLVVEVIRMRIEFEV